MKHNMEETTVQGIAYPVPVNERSERVTLTLSKQPLNILSGQPEEHRYAIEISIYEYEFKSVMKSAERIDSGRNKEQNATEQDHRMRNRYGYTGG